MIEFLTPRALRAGDILSEFDCGIEDLNRWLRSRARENEKRGASRTFVSVTREGRVAGYYCLSASSIARSDSPGTVGNRMPDPVPVVLLGRLAVDQEFAGHGLGRSLLSDAFARSVAAAETIAAAAIVVHASTDEVVGFYEQYGFERFPASSRTLFLRLSDARRAIGND